MFSDYRTSRFFIGVMALLMVSVLLVSCSVKEDRTGCPCFMILDFGGIETADLMDRGFKNMDVHVCAAGEAFADETFMLKNGVKEFFIAVPKTGVDVAVYCADGGRYSVLDGFTVDSGSPFPRVYMSAESVDTGSDVIRRAITLHKNWCGLKLCLKSSDNGIRTPFKVRLIGNVDGYCPSGRPHEGHFDYTSDVSMRSECVVNIPRQVDESLWMQVIYGESGDIRSFPIGEFIAASGYDWKAPDLDDVSVEMDFTKTGLAFSISGWRKTCSFEVTI